MPMAQPGLLLKLANVTKRYNSPENAGSLKVLDQISLEVASGESLAIVGPSGSGKSTLLHLMVPSIDQPRAKYCLQGEM